MLSSKVIAGPSPHMMSIGVLSRRTGVSPSTLRDWESFGIVRPSRIGTHRRYSADDVLRVRRALELRNRNYSPASIAAALGEDDAADLDDDQGGIPLSQVGGRLRQARLSRGMRLNEVSALADVSVSHLSTIERAGAVPSLALLQRLALCYEIDVADLFGGESDLSAPEVTTVSSADLLVSDGNRVRVRPLARGNLICTDLYEAEPAGGSGGSYAHVGEECVYVMEGQVEFCFGESDRRLLRGGDSLAFDSSIPHRWSNTGETVLRMVWSNARPPSAPATHHDGA